MTPLNSRYAIQSLSNRLTSSLQSRVVVQFIFALLLCGAVVAVYFPGLGGGFVFDDYPNIVDNTALHVSSLRWQDWMAAMFSSPASALQRPLAMLSFAVNCYFTGLDPWPMKLTGLIVHVLNTALVLVLARRLLATTAPPEASSRQREFAAYFIAAAWGLHPINLMAVLYVVQRMESLCHVFVFAGLWLYVSGRQDQLAGTGGWVRILAGLIPCTFLGLLAKESAALLPLYAVCLEACLFGFRGRDGRRDARLFGLFGLVLVLPMLLGIAWLLPSALSPAAYASRDFNLGERLMTEPRVVLTYLRWILLPDLGQMSLYHDDYLVSRGLWNPSTTLPALLAIPGLLAIAWISRRQRPLVSLGVLWFLGAQLLTATFIPLELVFEHRNYFASLGICLVLADLFLVMPGPGWRRHVGALAAVAFLIFCGAATYLRSVEWRSEVQFSISEAAKHPQSPRATYDYARTMVILTGYQPDSPYTAETLAALEQARRVPHSGVLPDQAALMFAVRTDRPLQSVWWQDMYDKLSHQPIGAQELASLTSLTRCAVDGNCDFPPAAMIRMYGAALSQGDNAEVLNIYGDYALNTLSDKGLALHLWQKASTLRPGEPQYHISLAKLLISQDRYDEARAEIALLRKFGRLGQNEAAAEILQRKLQDAIDGKKSPGSEP